MTSTPELAAAAEKLRGLARAVSAPDVRDQAFHAEGTDVTQGRTGLYDVATTQTIELAAFIAAMDPPVALAVADWLGCLAALDSSERGGDECGWCGDNHALAVARALTA